MSVRPQVKSSFLITHFLKSLILSGITNKHTLENKKILYGK
jgi:hypothetical protein